MINNLSNKIWEFIKVRSIFLLLFAFSLNSLEVLAQCNNISPFATANAPTTGTVTISTCSYQTEYSTINSVAAVTQYTCEIGSGGFITIRQGTPGGAVIASGVSPLTWSSTVAGTYYAHWNVDASCATATSCVLTTITYVGPASACTNPVAAGATVSSPAAACPSQNVTLSLNGATIGTGLSYQWVSGPSATGPWTNIVGANSSTYSTLVPSSTFFACEVTCASGTPVLSTPVEVLLNSFFNCYCPVTNAGGGCITNVSLNTLSRSSAGCENAPSNYTSVPASSATTTVYAGLSYPFSVGIDASASIISVWIDYNQNGIYETTEWEQVATNAAAFSTSTINLNIPLTAALGQTGMRVRTRLTGNTNGAGDACLNMGSGETEDYVITIAQQSPCVAPPTGGFTVASDSTVCSNQPFSLTLSGNSIGLGLTFQWQSSLDGINYTDITGAVSAFYSTTQSVDAFYRCILTCSSVSSTSIPVFVANNLFLDCYCIPQNTGGCLYFGTEYSINRVFFNTFDNDNSGCNSTALNGYTNFSPTSFTTSIYQGQQNVQLILKPAANVFTAFGVWIDFNQDGDFGDINEFVYSTPNTINAQVITSINIPASAQIGSTKMRVRSYPGTISAGQSCDSFYAGETEDYTIDVVPEPPCTNPPAAGITNSTIPVVCPSQLFNLYLTGNSFGTGQTYQWQSSSSISGPWSNISGAVSSTYQTSIGVDTYFRCVLTCGTGSSESTPVLITVNFGIACYCASGANFTGDTKIDSLYMNNIITGSPSATCETYTNNTSIVDTLNAGGTYNIKLRNGSCSGFHFGSYLKAWIDFNRNGVFETVEEIGSFGPTTSVGQIWNNSFVVPTSITPGHTYMRVVHQEGGNASMSACGNYGYGETEDYSIFLKYTNVCVSPPTAGTTVAANDSVCPVEQVLLSLSGNTVGANQTFQWQASSDGINYVNIPGAILPSYATFQAQTTFYRCELTCAGLSSTSIPVQVTTLGYLACYCEPTNDFGCNYFGTNYSIDRVLFNTFDNNNSSCNGSTSGYINYPISSFSTSVYQGQSGIALTVKPFTGTFQGLAAWIDFNQDGDFNDAGEFVWSTPGTVNSEQNAFVDIPNTAVAGLTKMRVRSYPGSITASQSCLAFYAGETEDYTISILPLGGCIDPPIAGITESSANPVCNGANFLLSLNGNTFGSGQTFQWQSSPDNITWTDITGANGATYQTTQTQATYYRCVTICGVGSATSTALLVGSSYNINCFCSNVPSSTADTKLNGFSFNTISTSTPGTLCETYSNYTNLNTIVNKGQTYAVSAINGSCSGNHYIANIRVWIDYNHNGIFEDPAERVSSFGPTTGLNTNFTNNITIPTTAATGETFMRVIISEGALPEPCVAYFYGETEDYRITVIDPPTVDAQLVELVTPNTTGCYSASESVSVKVKNVSTIQAHDFTVNPVTVNVNVTGAVTQTLSYLINNNSLNGGLALPIGSEITVPVGNLTMAAQGAYNISAHISSSADGNNYNDSLSNISILKSPGTAVSVGQICGGTSTDLELDNYNGTIQWQSFNGTAWVNETGTGSTSDVYTVSPSTNTQYRALVCGNMTSNAVTVTVVNITPPSVNGATVCEGLNGTLSASASSAGSISWFNSPTGGFPLATSPTYTVNNATATTTYYAQANQSAVPTSLVTIGTGTGTSSFAPLYTCYGYNYSQQIYLASELTNAGVTAGAISKIKFFYSTAAPASTNWDDNWVVYLGNTNQNEFATTTSWVPAAAMTQVYSGSVTVPAAGNWLEITLQTPFIWDGTSNLVLGLDENEAGWNCTAAWASTSTPNYRTILYYSDGTNPDPLSPPSANYREFGFANTQFEVVSGCTSPRVPVNLTVNPNPVVALTDSTVVCQGTISTLDAGSGFNSYLWSNGSTTQTIQTGFAGTYGVTVSNSFNCTTTDSTVVVVNALPNINLGPDATICSNQPLTLDAGSNYVSYNWSNGSQGSLIIVNTTGNYSVTVVDNNGCQATDIIAVTVVQAPNPQLSNLTICEGTTTTLNPGISSAGNSFVWSNGSSTPTINVSSAGTYSVTVTNSSTGCSEIATSVISIDPVPAVSISGDTVICINERITYTAAGSGLTGYQWSLGSANAGSTLLDGSVLGVGMHTLIVSATNGTNSCLSKDTLMVRVDACLGVNDLNSDKFFNIYPNPSSGLFNLNFGQSVKSGNINIEVTDAQGKLVFTNQLNGIQTLSTTIDLSGNASGIYMLRISTSESVWTEKLNIR